MKKLLSLIVITSFMHSCTKDSPSALTVTDIDGNVYETVKIGNQIWMKENLRTSHYRNGDLIPNVRGNTDWTNLSTGAWCWPANDSTHFSRYGKYYNYYTVDDSRGLAPRGWHVASPSEWEELANFLGGDSVAADKIKDTLAIYGWCSATNSSGFTALEAGIRGFDGEFSSVQHEAYWWNFNSLTSSSHSSLQYIYCADSKLYIYGALKNAGCSVRCIKD